MKNLFRIIAIAFIGALALSTTSCKSERTKICEKYASDFTKRVNEDFGESSYFKECKAKAADEGIVITITVNEPLSYNMTDETREMMTEYLQMVFISEIIPNLTEEDIATFAKHKIGLHVKVRDPKDNDIDFIIEPDIFEEIANSPDEDFEFYIPEDEEFGGEEVIIGGDYSHQDELLLDTALQPDTALVF